MNKNTLEVVPQSPFDKSIPNEIIYTILLYLSPKDIVNVLLTAKLFHQANMEDFLWEAKLTSHFDHENIDFRLFNLMKKKGKQKLLDKHYQENCETCTDGFELMHKAILCMQPFRAVFTILLDARLQESTDLYHYNQLMRSVYNMGNPEIFALFLDTWPERYLIRDDRANIGNTHIHWAIEYDSLDFLRLTLNTYPSQIEKRNNDQQTPLHLAIYKNNLAAVQMLIEHGANIYAKIVSKTDNEHAIHLACKLGHLSILQFLVEKFEINFKLDYLFMLWSGKRAIDSAAECGQEAIIDYLVALGTDLNASADRTPMEWAMKSGSIRVIKSLVRHGATIDARALKAAIHNYQQDAIELFVTLNPALLLNFKQDGHNLLSYTFIHGNEEAILFLIAEKEMDVLAVGKPGDTALHYACEQNYTRVIAWLMEHRSFLLNQLSSKEDTAIFRALKNGYLKTVQYLIQKGANIAGLLPKSIEMRATMIIELLLNQEQVKTDIEMEDKAGKNIWHLVAEKGCLGCALLLWNKAPHLLDKKDAKGLTPLMIVVSRNEVNLATWFIDCGANVNSTDAMGNTLLHWAAKNAKLEMIALLLKKNALFEGASYSQHHYSQSARMLLAAILNFPHPSAARSYFFNMIGNDSSQKEYAALLALKKVIFDKVSIEEAGLYEYKKILENGKFATLYHALIDSALMQGMPFKRQEIIL